MPRKSSFEFKPKAIRLANERVELEGYSLWAAAEEIGEKPDIPCPYAYRLFKALVFARKVKKK